MTKQVNKISDKLVKINETINIHMYDNGYVCEVSGRSKDDDWTNAKILCSDIDSVIALIKEASAMPRND
jgi:hypothetical protein